MTKEEFNKKLDVFIGELTIAARQVPFSELVIQSKTELCCRLVLESMMLGRRSFLVWYDKDKQDAVWGEE